MLKLQGVNLMDWIAANRELLKPPVGNKVILEEDGLLVMAVGGPNKRTDFHYNETVEFFYQIEGRIELDVQIEGNMSTIVIGEGDLYLLPAKVPHRPRRGSNTVGLVLELSRQPNQKDGLLWFCSKCNHKLFEKYFVLTNIETNFQPVFEQFNKSLEIRTCTECGNVNE